MLHNSNIHLQNAFISLLGEGKEWKATYFPSIFQNIHKVTSPKSRINLFFLQVYVLALL